MLTRPLLKVTEHKDVVRKNCLNSDWDTRYPGWILIWFSFISLKKFQDTTCIRKTFSVTLRFIIYQSTLLICQSPHHEGIWRMEVETLSFLISALEDVDGHLPSTIAWHPTKKPNTHWVGDWVETTVNVDGSRKETIYCLYRHSNTGTSSILRVVIPLQLTLRKTEHDFFNWVGHSLYPPHNSCIVS
jgi:hypothetical protein